jgi:glycosyltransferase XagB
VQHDVPVDLGMWEWPPRRVPMIGQLLLEAGYIDKDDLSYALAAQRARPEHRLGGILVDWELLTNQQLLEILMPQIRARLARGQVTPTSGRIGEVLVKAGLITPLELRTALVHQAQHGGTVGDALVALRVVSRGQIEMALVQAS